jgi:hypothetical protein
VRGWNTEWILEDHGSLYSGLLCIRSDAVIIHL